MRSMSCLLFLLLSTALAVAENTSAYTKYDPENCKVLTPANPDEEFGGAYLCDGLGELKIYFSEGDLRVLMAYGVNAFEHCSAQQTFGQFNYVTPTVEWRLKDGEPFAVIQRWHVSELDDASKTKSWLGVTKLEKANSCRVALIDGALPEANAIARQKADTLAAGFDCQTDTAEITSRLSITADELMSGTPCGPE